MFLLLTFLVMPGQCITDSSKGGSKIKDIINDVTENNDLGLARDPVFEEQRF